MFQKADKSELRIWLLGDILIILCGGLASVSLIGGAFGDSFKIGRLIWGIVFLGLTVLCVLFFVKIIKALKTYDSRAKDREEREALAKQEKEQAEAEKIALEQQEMEALKEQEMQKRVEMQEKLEAERKEKEALGEKFGEDEE